MGIGSQQIPPVGRNDNSARRGVALNTKTAAHQHYASPWWMALDCARLKEEMLELLEAAYREHSPRLIFLQNESLFDFLHSDARYQSLAKRLPPLR